MPAGTQRFDARGESTIDVPPEAGEVTECVYVAADAPPVRGDDASDEGGEVVVFDVAPEPLASFGSALAL